MGKLTLVINFIGSLIPVLFPDKGFQPKRLVAVLLVIGALALSIHFLGLESTEALVDLSEDVIELTEE